MLANSMEKVIDLNRWQREHVKSEQELKYLFYEVKAYYNNQPFPDLTCRLEVLSQLKQGLIKHQRKLIDALHSDYGNRSEFDSLICDVLPAVDHINYTIKHLKKWMKASKRSCGAMLIPSTVKVEYQPLGVVGVVAPWNFPIVLTVAPIVSALAAGNRVMIKLSEHTPNTNKVLSEIFAQTEQYLFPIEGGEEFSRYFVTLPFDHLFFTGSTTVGREVARQAAKNLTPVTLELGGKSPTIIAPDADIDHAVEAILLGKSVNAGQICVAPDYLLIPQGKELKFIERYLERFYQVYVQDGQLTSVTSIINQQHYQRLLSYLQDAQALGGTIHTIDYLQLKPRQMPPQLITGVSDKMLVMKEEIFGPILPVIGYRHVTEALAFINARPRPLALYLFSNDQILVRQVIEQTHSGGIAVNDTLLHLAAQDAPFGGVGESGMGQYHAEEGFRTFSNAKSVFSSPTWFARSYWILKYRSLITKLLGRLFVR